MESFKQWLIKHIGWISLGTSSLAFILSLLRFLPWHGLTSMPKYLNMILGIIIPNVQFSFMSIMNFSYRNRTTGLESSWVYPIFFLIMLIGSILYIRTSGRERRLLKFSYGVIIYASIAVNFYWFTTFKSVAAVEWEILQYFISAIITTILWVFISYTYLKYLLRPSIQENSHQENPTSDRYLPASKFERAMHWGIDMSMAVLLASGPLGLYAQRYFNHAFLGSYTVHFYIIILLLVYYLFFELLFKTTPGKLFTESIVQHRSKQKLSTSDILKRNFSRLIPFEPISWVFASQGWHDTISKTTVAKENKDVISIGKYFRYAILLVLVSFVTLIGILVINNSLMEKNEMTQAKQQIEDFRIKMNQVRENDIYSLEKKTYQDGGNHYSTFRVHEIREDDVVGSLFNIAKHSYQIKVEDYDSILQIRDNLTMKTFSKTELYEAIGLRSRYNNVASETIQPFEGLPVEEHKYSIKEVILYNAPRLELDLKSAGDDFKIKFRNKGWPADLIAVKKITGEYSIKTELPLSIPQSTAHDEYSIRLGDLKMGKTYALDLIFQNSEKMNYKQSVRFTMSRYTSLDVQEIMYDN